MEGLSTRYRSKQAQEDPLRANQSAFKPEYPPISRLIVPFSSWLGEIGPCHLSFSTKSLHHSSPSSSSAAFLFSLDCCEVLHFFFIFFFEARHFIRHSCSTEPSKAWIHCQEPFSLSAGLRLSLFLSGGCGGMNRQ